MVFFFFKQKTAYEMRISDWSSDVCSSDLMPRHATGAELKVEYAGALLPPEPREAADRPRLLLVLTDLPDLRRRNVDSEADAYMRGGIAERSEERRVGQACVSTCRSRWSALHLKKNIITTTESNHTT